MAKVFSVASWNVQHFKGEANRVARVVDFLKSHNPDVFALYEVTGTTVYDELTEKFPQYTFQITEGKQTQEILVAVRNNLTSFITQKTEFRSGASYMRPGSLVTIKKSGISYSLLFLHVASGNNPRGMGLRDDMIGRAIKFRKALDKKAGGVGQARYMFLGDLNTMGLEYPYKHDIPAEDELKKADNRASRYYGMERLGKTHDVTWSSSKDASKIPGSNLDHVYASTNLTFKKFQHGNSESKEVDVRGWVDTPNNTEKKKWKKQYSDHSLLYLEVHESD